jgi:hypothetical protein
MIEDKIDTALNTIGNYSVVFIDEPDGRTICIGSGTFIRFGKIEGILTCGHVLEALKKRAKVNIAPNKSAGSSNSTRIISINEIDFVKIYDEKQKDLGFFRLADEDLSGIKANFSFLNGDKQKGLFATELPHLADYTDVLLGAFNVLSKRKAVDENRAIVEVASHRTCGVIEPLKDFEEFDYLSFCPYEVPHEQEQAPDTFEATSGGGLWRVFSQKNSTGKFDVVEKRLVGVAFRERGKIANTIMCHGSKSIYKNLYEKILQKWPTSFS